MKVKIQKWGNSLAVRIPKALAEQTNIKTNTTADMSVEGEVLIIRPVQNQQYSLQQLVAEISNKNIHHEVKTGITTGKEFW
ncbi:MAG: AbrB/MazE/SpoVT family DNA-binding domain-containing protein [Spirochaetia bacterium]